MLVVTKFVTTNEWSPPCWQGREGSVTWDELTAQLAKRTEQCKKMEGNISGKRQE